MNRTGTVAAMLLASCLLVGMAQAAAIPALIRAELSAPRLLGQGSFRWFGLKIYDAALWVGKDGFQTSSPTSTRFVLELTYARDLRGARIAESSIDEIRRLGLGTAQLRDAWLVKMKSLFPDVHAGTRLSGLHLPGEGARFYLDGKLLGEIDDAGFARAFFSIWFDEHTRAADLRAQLLARPS